MQKREPVRDAEEQVDDDVVDSDDTNEEVEEEEDDVDNEGDEDDEDDKGNEDDEDNEDNGNDEDEEEDVEDVEDVEAEDKPAVGKTKVNQRRARKTIDIKPTKGMVVRKLNLGNEGDFLDDSSEPESESETLANKNSANQIVDKFFLKADGQAYSSDEEEEPERPRVSVRGFNNRGNDWRGNQSSFSDKKDFNSGRGSYAESKVQGNRRERRGTSSNQSSGKFPNPNDIPLGKRLDLKTEVKPYQNQVSSEKGNYCKRLLNLLDSLTYCSTVKVKIHLTQRSNFIHHGRLNVSKRNKCSSFQMLNANT